MQEEQMPASPENSKSALRKAMRGLRRSLSAEEVFALSRSAQTLILADPAWQKAAAVGLYYPLRQELRTQTLLERAWEEGKNVYLPQTRPDDGSIRLLPCGGFGSLVPGAFGIMEPDPAACPPPPRNGRAPELVIVPGLAFDAKGHRLGMGSGWYDRRLSSPGLAGAIRLGLAYSFQILDLLPADPWDVPMHGLCTEKELTWLAG
jgi:5-formyltetrahydrofolate cyclo-ligase